MKQALTGLAVSALGVTSVLADDQKGFEFLAFGDMPYGGSQINYLEQAAKKLKASDIPFALFFGDMKSGGKRCSEKRYEENLSAIFGVTEKPVFLTLGDNDWTDCDRKGDNELAKLYEIRERAYRSDYLPENRTTMNINRDISYPELVRFQYENLYITTQHIVGTGNGREEVVADNKNEILTAVDLRDAKNKAWLEESFRDVADADRMVVFIHADVTEDSSFLGKEACGSGLQENCDPYASFIQNLKEKAAAYEKPVLLIHGSTKVHCIQQGFLGEDNLTRFNGAGDGVLDLSFVKWNGKTGFEFKSFNTGKNVKTCD